jgi:hypothetical protein
MPPLTVGTASRSSCRAIPALFTPSSARRTLRGDPRRFGHPLSSQPYIVGVSTYTADHDGGADGCPVAGERTLDSLGPQRRAELAHLVTILARGGYAAELDQSPYSGYGVTWHEVVHVLLQPEIVPLETLVPKDVYDRMKAWGRKCSEQRRETQSKPRPQSFMIFGPDGEVLQAWTIDADGEQASPPDERDDE